MTHLGLTPPLQISFSPTTEKKIEKMPFISPFKIKNEIGCDFFFDLLPFKTEFQSISWASVLHSDYSSPNRGVGKSQLFRGLSVQASLQAVLMDSEHGLVFSLCAFNLPSRGTELNNHDPLVPLLHPARTGHFSCRLSISRPGCRSGPTKGESYLPIFSPVYGCLPAFMEGRA